MLDQRLFLSLSGKFYRFACAVFFATTISAVTTAQTLVTGPLTGTPSAGEYYHSSGITLSPNFTFTAGPGQGLHLYISSVACMPLAATPSNGQNYVVTYTPRVAGVSNPADPNNSTCQVMQTVQYFDGLGRPLQTVQVKGSPGGTNDIVQPVSYDAFGREAKKYLPYTTGGTPGSYRTAAISDQLSFYNLNGNGTSGSQQSSGVVVNPNPFSVTVFEPSPLNRPFEQGAPGNPWQPGQDINSDHTVRMEYGTNAASGDYAVRLFNANAVTTSGHEYECTLNSSGNYDTGQLYLTVSKDENWQGTDGLVGQTHEYKDKEGRMVLKRTFNSGGQVLSTYYIYDDFGNLSFVLPPGASPDGGAPSQMTLDNFCYQYRYDGRNRLVENKVPGKGWEFMVYNTLDQVVMSQDPNQRNQSPQTWTFTKYDGIGRTVMTGLWNYGSSQASAGYDNGGRLWLENYYNTTAEPKWETRDDATSTGYNNQSTPIGTGYTFLTINYYDDYSFPGSGTFGTAAPNTVAGQSSSIHGLLTGSKVNILGTGTMLLTVNYYDDKGRVVQSKSQNHLGGQDMVSNTYDFTNELLSSTRSHVANGATTTIANRYTYDHIGRKVETWQKINSDGEVQLSALQYNEIGQLKTKTLGGGLQATGYAYNERGWLNTANSSNNLFNLDLRYNSPDAGVQQQWNGNISQMNYQGNSSGFKQFSYNYDRLNRLIYAQSSNNLLNEGISYDVMGNITQLDRGGAGMGSLYYTSYTGNQMNTVTGYSPRNYSYDPNGNTTSDGQGRGIEYNLLNLPQRITQPGNNNTLATYTYDATGDKLRNTGSDGSWDYIGGIVYHNNNIELVSTEVGRAVPKGGGSYSYQYYLKDHLGNTRVSFDRASNGQAYVLQEDEYYSFGFRKPLFDASSNNRYLYNGKEVQIDLAGQYDYGARFYDPVVGRWGVPDPKASLLEMSSPYVYSLNSPVNFIDKDGELPIYINGRVTSDSERGNASYWDYQLLRTIASSGIPNPGGTAHFVDGDRFLYTNPVTYEDRIENGGYISGNEPGQRQTAGYKVGLGDFQNVLAQLARDPKTGKITEKIQIYTHSRGAAFGAGYTEALLEMIKQHADEFADAEHEIDYVYNMGAHQSNAIDEPAGVNAYSQHHDLDALSGNGMGGVKAAFSSKETSGGLFGPHSTSSFVKDVGAFTKAFQSSNGDSSKLIDDFVKKMKKDYGVNVTVK